MYVVAILIAASLLAIGVTGIVSAVFAKLRPPKSRAGKILHWIVPLTSPVWGAMLLLGVLAIERALAPDDWDRFEELFGFETTMADPQMISDDFGSGDTREVLIRIEPGSKTDLSFLDALPLRRTDMIASQFEALNDQRRRLWWYGREPDDFLRLTCPNLVVDEAPGFNGWKSFTVGRCFEGGDLTQRPRTIYIWAKGRL